MQASAAAAYESHTMLRRRHGHRQHEDAHLHLRIRLESAAARVLSAERGPAGSTCRSAAKKIVDRDAQLDHGSNVDVIATAADASCSLQEPSLRLS